MDYESIVWNIPEDGIGELTLNRPRRYNSVNMRMLEELEDLWAGLKRKKDACLSG